MRLNDKNSHRLIDVPILQADRLRDPYFAQALEQGAFDPFPDGTHAVDVKQERGALAINSGITETELSGGALTSFDSALPEHIQDALQLGMHNDNTAMKAFLAIFDKRLMHLDIGVLRAGVLVATQDAHGIQAASILDRLLRMVRADTADKRNLKLLFPLLSRVRSLSGLRDAVSWFTNRDVRVSVNFNTSHPIDQDSRTYLSTCLGGNAGLGKGTLLGNFGRTPMGRISIYIACTDIQDIKELESDEGWPNDLTEMISHVLRDPVPVTIYADVMRHMVSAPVLSSQKEHACMLGSYNILQPERSLNQRASIKLTEISI